MSNAFNSLAARIRAVMLLDTGAGGLFNASNPIITGHFTVAAPQDQETPYSVLIPVSMVDDGTFSSDGMALRVQFSMFHSAHEGSAVGGLYLARLRALFHKTTLTSTTGYTTTSGKRETERQVQEDLDFLHSLAEYTFLMTEQGV